MRAPPRARAARARALRPRAVRRLRETDPPRRSLSRARARQILRAVHGYGVELDKPIDAEGYGNAFYYAAFHGRVQIMEELWRLDYKLARDIPVNKFGETLEHYIVACNPPPVQAEMFAIIEKEEAAATRLQSISRAMEDRKHFMAVRKASKLLQARLRGMQERMRRAKAAEEQRIEAEKTLETQRKVMASISATDDPFDDEAALSMASAADAPAAAAPAQDPMAVAPGDAPAEAAPAEAAPAEAAPDEAAPAEAAPAEAAEQLAPPPLDDEGAVVDLGS